MSLFDPVYLTATGEPIPGRVPVRLVIEDGGAPTARQMAELDAVYADFCTDKRQSLVQYHDVQRTLSDGSRVRLNSIYGVDTVYARIEPSGDLDPVSWVAYSTYTDMEWLDIYNRIVLGGTGGGVSPPGDPEPEFTEPRPDRDDFPGGGPPAEMRITVVHSQDGDGWPSAAYSYTNNFGGGSGSGSMISVPDDIYIGKYTHVNTPKFAPNPSEEDPSETPGGSVRIGGANWYWLGPNSWESEGINPLLNGWGVLRSFWQYTVSPEYDYSENFSLVEAALLYEDARSAAIAAGNAAYEAAFEAWRASWITWRDTKWQPWLDRIINSYVTSPSDKPLVNVRRAGRALQLDSLRRSLDVGVSMPHLAARYMACPFNIITKPNGELPAGPENAVAASAPSGAPHRSVTYTLSGAVRESEWVDNITEPWDVMPFSRAISPFDQDTPHLLGRDFANPKNLFGWVATGSVQRIARYRPYHAAERAYVDPRSLGGLSFSDRSGYKTLMEKGVVTSDETTLRVSTDGYIPPGTKLTMVQLEYEVFDPYTEQWIWTPHVHITQYDAVWIEAPGDYIVESLPDTDSEGHSPRKIRVRNAFEQVRNADQSWTSPKAVPITKPWEKDAPASLAYTPPAPVFMWHHPTGIAILEGLSPVARPRQGTSTFGFGAVAIWPDMESFEAILNDGWEDQPDMETLCVAALRAVGKLNSESP